MLVCCGVLGVRFGLVSRVKVAASVSPLHVLVTPSQRRRQAVTCLFRAYHVAVARHVWDLICSSFGQLQPVDFLPSGGQALIIYFYHPNGGSTATQPSVARPLWERACTGGGSVDADGEGAWLVVQSKAGASNQRQIDVFVQENKKGSQ